MKEGVLLFISSRSSSPKKHYVFFNYYCFSKLFGIDLVFKNTLIICYTIFVFIALPASAKLYLRTHHSSTVVRYTKMQCSWEGWFYSCCLIATMDIWNVKHRNWEHLNIWPYIFTFYVVWNGFHEIF